MELHSAARDDKPLLVSSLLSQDAPLVSSRDEDDRLALHWAASVQNADMVLTLLSHHESQKSPIDVKDASGFTPLHIASSTGSRDIVALLLPHSDPNATTNLGTTALHMASSKNHVDVVKELLEVCNVKATDKRGTTALHRAAAAGHIQVVRLLMQFGAQANNADRGGWTAVHHAMAEGHGDVAVLLASSEGSFELQTKDGETPYDVAPKSVADYVRRNV